MTHRPTWPLPALTQVSCCLKVDPRERPTFAEIAASLDLILGPATSMPQAGSASQDATAYAYATASMPKAGHASQDATAYDTASMPQAGHASQDVTAVGAAASGGGGGVPLSLHHLSQEEVAASSYHWAHRNTLAACLAHSREQAATATATASSQPCSRVDAVTAAATATTATAMMTTASSQRPWYSQTTVTLPAHAQPGSEPGRVCDAAGPHGEAAGGALGEKAASAAATAAAAVLTSAAAESL